MLCEVKVEPLRRQGPSSAIKCFVISLVSSQTHADGDRTEKEKQVGCGRGYLSKSSSHHLRHSFPDLAEPTDKDPFKGNAVAFMHRLDQLVHLSPILTFSRADSLAENGDMTTLWRSRSLPPPSGLTS